VTEGGDTELDSSLIENLVDPLKHMLRNAVSHGIETPEQRVAAGKPREGTVRLRACQEGGSIAIEISDDGAGMDPERLRQTAVKKGLRSAAQVAGLSDQQALGLIFLAGFSTAEQVSDVSGRGVGMDVVTSNLEKVGGSVTLHSEMGKGTVVALRLPLTVAIIRGLLVTSTDIIFALPLSAVQRVHRAGREEVSLLQRQPAITLGEQVLPLTSLARATGLLQCEPPLADKTNVVVVTADGRDQGLMVDDILGNEELVIQPLGKALGEVKVLSGVAVLGDGRLALIVDVSTLLRLLRGEAATAVLLAA
jgi:two-component system chemotaxis sensor kinase CheA